MGKSKTVCYCISNRNCKNPLADKAKEWAEFQRQQQQLRDTLTAYLAEEEYCVPNATEEDRRPDDAAERLAQAFQVACALQRQAYDRKSHHIFEYNAAIADILIAMQLLAADIQLPGNTKPGVATSALDMSQLRASLPQSLSKYSSLGTLESNETIRLLARAYVKSLAELRAAARLKEPFSLYHHTDIVVDIITEMFRVWRFLSPEAHDPEYYSESLLPDDHPHKRVLERFTGDTKASRTEP